MSMIDTLLNLAHRVVFEHENLEDDAMVYGTCPRCNPLISPLGEVVNRQKRTCAYHQACAILNTHHKVLLEEPN